jgi:dienelactone hydrolase
MRDNMQTNSSDRQARGWRLTCVTIAGALTIGALPWAITGRACAATTVQFEPASPEIGPFPSDALTVYDPAQKTGRRINLPLPDCAREVTACGEVRALNEFDGFSVFPRLRVRFSGRVNVETLREGVFFIALDNLTREEYGLGPAGKLIPINQVVYDPETHTVYAKPDEVLDQHRKYALLVTNAVRDAGGAAVEADPRFLACIDNPSDPYCGDLAAIVRPVNELTRRLGGTRRIVAASVFTTLSATAWLEKARDLLPSFPAVAAPAASKSVFAVSDLQSLVLKRQLKTSPPTFEDVQVSTASLQGVARIAFGTYRSPDFLNEQRQVVTAPSGEPLRLPVSTAEISFNAFLPSSPKPATGYPVVIVAHGSGDSRFGMAFAVAGTMAAAGYATVAINTFGHGYGPDGKVVITERGGAVTELTAGGRGIDLNRDGTITANEGCASYGPGRNHDCQRQTALDIMQLVRVIRAGADLDGDRLNDLDANRVHLIGFSLGSWIAAQVAAVDPFVSATVLNATSASVVESLRWSAVNGPAFTGNLAQRIPPIPPNRGTDFNDNYVLRDQPVKINDVPGAIQIQNIYEVYEWISLPGDPLSYAPHLRLSTLPGVPIKRVLFQIAIGDRSLPPPPASALIRAAGMGEWMSLYRHDLARGFAPQLPDDAHRRIIGWWNPASTAGPVFAAMPAPVIAAAVQRQAADFFGSGERCNLVQPCILDVNDIVEPVFGRKLFETPRTLPEDPSFLVP